MGAWVSTCDGGFTVTERQHAGLEAEDLGQRGRHGVGVGRPVHQHRQVRVLRVGRPRLGGRRERRVTRRRLGELTRVARPIRQLRALVRVRVCHVCEAVTSQDRTNAANKLNLRTRLSRDLTLQ